MINIQLETPSFEQYIKEFGKQEIKKMFLSFLEIKFLFGFLYKKGTIKDILQN